MSINYKDLPYKTFCFLILLLLFFGRITAAEKNSFSEKGDFVTTSTNDHSLEEIEIYFSQERNLYEQPIELILTSNSAGVEIYYTIDCSVPSTKNGYKYEKAILIDSTIVLKAIAVTTTGSSKVFTHSYIFPESSANQGKKPKGFPETWGGVKIIPADYEMDPEVIHHLDYSDGITDAFKSLPSLSLTMDTDEWFNHDTGLYFGYPNSNETREKPVTAEFIFNTYEENFAVKCGVQNQGGTSIVNWKSPKQSMRLLFKEMYGPTRLRKKLFHDSEIESINTLVVDAMLNATWIHPTDDKQRLHAMYLRDQLASDLYNEMGELSFHGRYFNLFLNGLYWGIINLHERPDDAFLSEYLDAEREDFDIVKHRPDEAVSGSNVSYNAMLNRARMGFPSYSSLEDFQYYLDIPAFINYMILNFYLGNYDWARHNYYAGRKRSSENGFRFYPWDSELVMRFLKVDYDNTEKNNEGAPTEIHTLLKENEEYRLMFADAVYKHLFNDGTLTPENFRKMLNQRKEEIEKAIVLESARWGDYRENVSATTYTKNEYWIPEVNKALEEYIPKRRDIVVEQFRNNKNKLFPKYMPPVIQRQVEEKDNVELILKNPNVKSGVIYYTTDGTDPRSVGGGIHGAKYTGEIAIGNSSVVKTRFYSAEDKVWSALVEEVVLMDDVIGEKLTINEIMYHPQENLPEFVEIMNFGEHAINLNGFSFSGGINFKFRLDYFIEPGTGVVLTDNNLSFSKTYNFSAYMQYEKRLSNSGESIYFSNSFGQLVDSVSYSDSIPWPEKADGDGYSLELKHSELDNALASSWQTSEKMNGTPYQNPGSMIEDNNLEMWGYPNPYNNEYTILINERVLDTEIFQIDVYNNTGSKVHSEQSTIVNSRIQLNLKVLKPGIYFIKINASRLTTFQGGVLKAIKID